MFQKAAMYQTLQKKVYFSTPTKHRTQEKKIYLDQKQLIQLATKERKKLIDQLFRCAGEGTEEKTAANKEMLS